MTKWRRGLSALLGIGMSIVMLGCGGDRAVDGMGQESLYTTAPELVEERVATAAPTATPEPVPVELEEPVTSFPQYLDLDGDGVKELIELEYPEEPMEAPEGETEEIEKMQLRIVRGDTSWVSEVAQSEEVRLFISDVDGDGMEELLLEVQLGETVYRLYGWRFTGEELVPLLFEGEESFTGCIESLKGKRLTLHCWVELLGSHMLEQDWRLTEEGFIPDEESWTVLETGLGEEAYPLRVLEELFAYAEDEEEGTELFLPQGTRLKITRTDLGDKVWFETETGDRGYLEMSKDAEGRFTVFEGRGEAELFGGMEYTG